MVTLRRSCSPRPGSGSTWRAASPSRSRRWPRARAASPSGDLDHRVDVAADDELGVLVESFNRMTGELRDSHLLLEAKNEELVQINQRLDGERGADLRRAQERRRRRHLGRPGRPRLDLQRRRAGDAPPAGVGAARSSARGGLGRRRARQAARAPPPRAAGAPGARCSCASAASGRRSRSASRRCSDPARSGDRARDRARRPDRADPGAEARHLERSRAARRARDQEPAHPDPPLGRAAAQEVPRGRPRPRRRARGRRQDHRARSGVDEADGRRVLTLRAHAAAAADRGRPRGADARDAPALPRRQARRRAGVDGDLGGAPRPLRQGAAARRPHQPARQRGRGHHRARLGRRARLRQQRLGGAAGPATAGRAFPPRPRRSCSSPTIRPRDAAPVSASPSSTASSPITAAPSGSRTIGRTAPCSPSSIATRA